VLLRVLAGLDVADVAEILGKQPGAVRVLAHRGLRRLAELMLAGATPPQNCVTQPARLSFQEGSDRQLPSALPARPGSP
jgi:RNA polymerase sigma-70 factor (ECF subfamily)